MALAKCLGYGQNDRDMPGCLGKSSLILLYFDLNIGAPWNIRSQVLRVFYYTYGKGSETKRQWAVTFISSSLRYSPILDLIFEAQLLGACGLI